MKSGKQCSSAFLMIVPALTAPAHASSLGTLLIVVGVK